MTNQDHPYQQLTPDIIFQAIESLGYACDGRLLALNSYENRVYRVGIMDSAPIIAKFYRPNRWSDQAILEEHTFTQQLAEREIPVIAPLQINSTTLHHHADFRLALYPFQPGRSPEFDNLDNLRWMGRFIGRIHALGKTKKYEHRPALTIETYGFNSLGLLQEKAFIPVELLVAYTSIAKDVLQAVQESYARAGTVASIRLHGDCHPGNVLWTEHGPHFVDFDDSCMAPAVQDLWMLISGDRDAMTKQFTAILTGYQEFCDFKMNELHLVEALRALRMLNYSAWLASRWADPAFPINFPWFNTQHYWQDQILSLREQLALLQEPPLEITI